MNWAENDRLTKHAIRQKSREPSEVIQAVRNVHLQWRYSPCRALASSMLCPPGLCVTDLVFQVRMPSNTMASSLTAFPHHFLCFPIRLLQWTVCCGIFCGILSSSIQSKTWEIKILLELGLNTPVCSSTIVSIRYLIFIVVSDFWQVFHVYYCVIVHSV
jgi:hypothetical protein